MSEETAPDPKDMDENTPPLDVVENVVDVEEAEDDVEVSKNQEPELDTDQDGESN